MIPGIIIPFRNREDHLRISAPILSRFGNVYVVEQMDSRPFNRAKLINAGYLEFRGEFDYLIAHDVDMIPQEDVDYSFCENPCHLATKVECHGYRLPYPKYFGGVTILPKDKFEEVNGFSNLFEGWGGEDDYLLKRFEEKNISIESRQSTFECLHHIRDFDHNLRMKNADRYKAPIDWGDGLNSCHYEIVHCEDFKNFTLLQVRL